MLQYFMFIVKFNSFLMSSCFSLSMSVFLPIKNTDEFFRRFSRLQLGWSKDRWINAETLFFFSRSKNSSSFTKFKTVTHIRLNRGIFILRVTWKPSRHLSYNTASIKWLFLICSDLHNDLKNKVWFPQFAYLGRRTKQILHHKRFWQIAYLPLPQANINTYF